MSIGSQTEQSPTDLSVSRRSLLSAAIVGGLAGAGAVRAVATSANAAGRGLTGEAKLGLQALDSWMIEQAAKRAMPGLALAVVRGGVLVYARGHGTADVETGTPVTPDSRFRIASVSKPMTASVIMMLSEQGKLDLDAPVVRYLPQMMAVAGETIADPRWRQIRIRHLLDHSGGFDRAVTYDPNMDSFHAATGLGVALPVTAEQVIQWQLRQRLDFDPGARYAYSNFGYCLLGRVIEQVTGKTYAGAMQALLFQPLGIGSAAIGGSLLDERQPGEARYYTDETLPAVVGPAAGTGPVNAAYGGLNIPLFDSHGGFVMSAPDLARFGAAFDPVSGGTRGGLMSAATAARMFKPSSTIPDGHDGEPGGHYSLGWRVIPHRGGTFRSHGGVLHSTGAMLIRMPDGGSIAFLTNTGGSRAKGIIGREIETPLADLYASIRRWPA